MTQHQAPRRSPPAEMLRDVDASLHARIVSHNEADAALAMLEVIDSLPAFSSSVPMASAWLAEVRAAVQRLGDACPEGLEIRLLAAIARTAFAARETTPALAASDAALGRAVESGDLLMQVTILAQRLPFLAHTAPVTASRDMRALDALLAQLPPSLTPGHRESEVALAHIAWAGATGDTARLRRELAAFGRQRWPEDERLTFCAYATRVALAQLYLRQHQRADAAKAVVEAAQLADAHDAIAELANLQAVIAALAVQAGDFHSAVAHAHAAVAHPGACRHVQPDPWLGLPLDICLAHNPGQAVQALAEAILHAQDLGDATGFFVAVTAMAAFYLADQRAMEALDALNEAGDVAKSLSDPTIAPAIRKIAESLLRHLGILRN